MMMIEAGLETKVMLYVYRKFEMQEEKGLLLCQLQAAMNKLWQYELEVAMDFTQGSLEKEQSFRYIISKLVNYHWYKMSVHGFVYMS